MNIDLKVREIASNALGHGRVDGIYSDSTLPGLGADVDTLDYFWRTIEQEFDIAVTRAQRGQLSTIGQIVHYVKVRRRAA